MVPIGTPCHEGVIGMSEEGLERARAYVERMRREGYAEERIREQLLASGWAEEDLGRVLGRPEPPPAPLAPAPERDAAGGYQEIAETVGMVPSLRRQDNIIQGIIVAVGSLIGALAGGAGGGGGGALIGLLLGLIVSAFVSGFVLMIVGAVRAVKRRRPRR